MSSCRHYSRGAGSPRIGIGIRRSEQPPKGQADPLAHDARLARDTVDVVALTRASHHEERPVAELEVLARSVVLPPRLDEEAAARAERNRGHRRIRTQLR